MKIVMGDLNIKVDNDSTSYEGAICEDVCCRMDNNENVLLKGIAAQRTTMSSARHCWHTQTSTNLPGVPVMTETKIDKPLDDRDI